MARDLRRYHRQTTVRLIAGGLILLYIIGDGLIYLLYGKDAALTGLLCITLGLLPMVLIWLALQMVEWVVHRADQEEET